MTITELLNRATTTLKHTDTPRLDAAVILSHILGVDRVYLAVHGAEVVGDAQCAAFESAVLRRADAEPVAYITGIQEFMSLDFEVCAGVLIPRGDTETLCEYVIERVGDIVGLNNKISILDICCGSGCIGISLAKYIPNSRVVMADISETALAMSWRNIERHSVGDTVRAVRADIMSGDIDGAFDVIVSNPPYIESGVIPGLDADVREYEPRLALDGGADGLMFYRRIADVAPAMLRRGGILAFEVGHTQADAVAEIMRAAGMRNVEIKRDLAGVQRVVAAEL